MAAMLLVPSLAAADHTGPLDPMLAAAQAGANQLAGTTLGFAGTALGMASTAVGVSGPLLGAIPVSPLTQVAQRQTLLALGAGTARQEGIAGSCQDLQMLLEWHQAVSQETNLSFYGFAGNGSPFLTCTSGWSNSFKPHEVSGDPQRGIVVYSRTIDAHTDLTLSPKRPDGSRDLWIRQVTFPDGFGHVMEFQGKVRDL